MKYVIAYYIVSTLIYFGIGGNSQEWAVFNMLSILGSMSVAMLLFLRGYSLKGRELAWFEFALIMTIARWIYTTSCAFAPYEWIYLFNKFFVFFFVIWIVIKVIRRRGI